MAQDSERRREGKEGKGAGGRPSTPSMKAAPQGGAPAMRQQTRPRQGGPEANVQKSLRDRRDAARPKAAERRERPAQPKQLMEQRSTKQRERAAERQNERKRAGERAAERKRSAERQRAVEQDRKVQADQRKQADKVQAGKRKDERPDAEKREGPRAAAHEEVRRKRLNLSVEQRIRLRSSFNVNHGRATNVRFARRVGTRIPRSVRLIAIPAAVYAVFPGYRSYSYVTVEDDIYIVNPDTYEIVDVIDEDGPPPRDTPQTAQLTLTAAERELVLDSIPPGFPEADIRLRLALGAEIPDQVELHEFAPVVLDSVPKLRDFRFVLAQGTMAVVDPGDRSIELVLER
jgi:hypothetical protein